MSLKYWLASLKADVTAVTSVHTPIHAGMRGNDNEASDVTGVTHIGGSAEAKRSVTAAGNQTLQLEPLCALGCTLVTSVTAEKINTGAYAEDDLLSGNQLVTENTESRQVFKQQGAWLTDTERLAARAYHAHHFNCHTCTAAGRGHRYASRCTVGLALWNTYLRGSLKTHGEQAIDPVDGVLY